MEWKGPLTNSWYFLLFWLSIWACKADFKTLPSGLKYQFVVQKNALVAQEGEYLMIDLTARSLKTDSVLFSTAAHQTLLPYRHDSYRLAVGTDDPLEAGFHLMGLGDSVLFLAKAEALSTTVFAGSLPQMEPQEEILLCAKAVSILPYQEYKQWQKRQIEQRERDFRAQQTRLSAQQKAEIRSLLAGQGKEYIVRPSGIAYYLLKSGSGPKPRSGDSVRFHYTVRYADGTPLKGALGRSGQDGQTFVLGKTEAMPCWQESLSLLSGGAQGRFYFPSSCLEGVAGKPDIRLDAILIVDLELESVQGS